MEKKIRTLSMFSYYGGKSRMAHLIAEKLNYDTDIYIEPFGGGCRTLLNKPRHEVEIYNDSSAGIVALVELLSKEDTAIELIGKLHETEYTQECFSKALKLRNEYEDNYLQELTRQISKLLRSVDKEHKTNMNTIFRRQLRSVYEMAEEPRNGIDLSIDSQWEKLNQALDDNDRRSLSNCIENINNIIQYYIDQYREDGLTEEEDKEIQSKIELYMKLKGKGVIEPKVDHWIDKHVKKQKKNKAAFIEEENQFIEREKLKPEEQREASIIQKKYIEFYDEMVNKLCAKLSNAKYKERFMSSARNTRDAGIDKMSLAIATYVVYAQSRDGMGTYWSSTKYKTSENYHNAIDRLYEVMHRLQGVNASQVDALAFFTDHKALISGNTFLNYIDNERVMIYCDPTYLKEGQSAKEEIDPLKEEYNPGRVYKHYWGRKEHELFLKTIQKAKCKILVSNYRDQYGLYDQYLNKENGWNSFEVETTTSMSNKMNNYRTEVLWYNYNK